MIDLRPLMPKPKLTPPLAVQLPNESQRFWNKVTTAIKDKKFTEATKLKQELEEKQRQIAKERENTVNPFKPRFFTQTIEADGKPELSDQGRETIQHLQEGQWDIQEGVGAGLEKGII